MDDTEPRPAIETTEAPWVHPVQRPESKREPLELVYVRTISYWTKNHRACWTAVDGVFRSLAVAMDDGDWVQTSPTTYSTEWVLDGDRTMEIFAIEVE